MIQVDKEFLTVEPAEGGGFTQVEPGGYVLQVVGVSEKPSQAGNAMITLDLDIAEGPCDGAFEKYPKKYFQLVNGEHLAYFKGMLKHFKESNSEEKLRGLINQQLQVDSQKLLKCLVGGAIGQVEYLDKNTGEIKIGLEVRWLCPIKEVPTLKAPPLKKLNGSRPAAKPAAGLAVEDDLPF